MKHSLSLILAFLFLFSFSACNDDDDSSEELSLYPENSLYDTKYYGLTGKVKTAERITYNRSTLEWDSQLNKVTKSQPQSKEVYEFDKNGVLSTHTTYYVKYDYDYTNNEYHHSYYMSYRKSYIYDSKYRENEYTNESYGTYGDMLTYINKVITTYDDINKTATRMVYSGYADKLEPFYKEVYKLDDNGYIDNDKPMDHYWSADQQKSASDEFYEKRETKNIMKKDSKGNWVERYEVSLSAYASGEQYNNVYMYEEQNIIYYDSPVNGIILEETVKPVYNRYSALIYKSSNLGINGKVESVTMNHYDNYYGASFVSWDWVTDKLTKNMPSSKYIGSYDKNDIRNRYEVYETYYDYYNDIKDIIRFSYSQNIEYDAKFRITVLDVLNNSYESVSSEIPTSVIHRTKEVITYDDVNKKATIATYYATNNEELKLSSTSNVYNLDSDGNIDSSYWESFVSKDAKTSVKPNDFEPNPSSRYEPRLKYDQQNNLIENYTVIKELDATGKVVGGDVNYLFEKIITYRK